MLGSKVWIAKALGFGRLGFRVWDANAQGVVG